MKKFLLLTTLMVLTSMTYGQDVVDKWRGLSVAGTISMTKINSDVSAIRNFRPGYAADIYTGYNINEQLSVDAGLQYSSIGGDKDGKDSDASSIELNYISIPVDLNIHIVWGIHGSIGAYAGYCIGDRDRSWEYAASSGASTTATAGAIDAGVRYRIFYDLNKKVRFAAGYSQGLTNVFQSHVTTGKEDMDLMQDHITSKNSLFYFSLGFKLF